MSKRTDIMISSTARDLPLHRKEAMDACLRMGMFPIMMEHLPSSEMEAVSTSIKMVDQAEIYLGIFAWRYGYIPSGYDISITEMEYNRAFDRKMPTLIFFMHEDHQVKDIDLNEGLNNPRLINLKTKISTRHIVNYFRSPEELRAQIIHSLVSFRQPNPSVIHSSLAKYIPFPPEPYIAHPYTLLQTTQLIGRVSEMKMLDEWLSNDTSSEFGNHPILNFIIAIGGMGKSALTWKWFNEVVPRVMKPLAGKIWWSFYESDSRYENFITRTLSYVSGHDRDYISTVPFDEKEEILLALLRDNPYLLVLDGLERLMVAYSRVNAERLRDDELDNITSNYVVGATEPQDESNRSLTGQHHLRRIADPRASAFLKKLTTIEKSRVLITSRLYPSELQSLSGHVLPSTGVYFLRGLPDNDALKLWSEFGVTGATSDLISLFHTFDNYPLLIRSLAGEVARYRRAPGDFYAWRRNYKRFDPFSIPVIQVKSHVLEYSMKGINSSSRYLLQTIAAFRMPATYDSLVNITTGEGKIFQDEDTLDLGLVELEERGLVGWDKKANRYDLHPVVRGVVWSNIEDEKKKDIYRQLLTYFKSIGDINKDEIKSIDDLTSIIEMYNSLMGLGKYDEAINLFSNQLREVMWFKLSANREQLELLEMLFPNGLDNLPELDNVQMQIFTLNALGTLYHVGGRPDNAAKLYKKAGELINITTEKYFISPSLNQRHLSGALRLLGSLKESEIAAYKALIIDRETQDTIQEASSIRFIGVNLGVRGQEKDTCFKLLEKSARIFNQSDQPYSEGATYTYMGQCALWFQLWDEAEYFANKGWVLAEVGQYAREFSRAARVQGIVALKRGKLDIALERLSYALTRCRQINFIEEEIPSAIALADLYETQGRYSESRDLLNDIWGSLERGSYRLDASDAHIVLSKIEQKTGNLNLAVTAALNAYKLAWCDGYPYSYNHGIEMAKLQLLKLGESLPHLPEYSDLNYELFEYINPLSDD